MQKQVTAFFLSLLLLTGLTACTESREMGGDPQGKNGQYEMGMEPGDWNDSYQNDDMMDDLGRAGEDLGRAAGDVGRAVEDSGRAVRRGVDDVGDAIEEMTPDMTGPR